MKGIALTLWRCRGIVQRFHQRGIRWRAPLPSVRAMGPPRYITLVTFLEVRCGIVSVEGRCVCHLLFQVVVPRSATATCLGFGPCSVASDCFPGHASNMPAFLCATAATATALPALQPKTFCPRSTRLLLLRLQAEAHPASCQPRGPGTTVADLLRKRSLSRVPPICSPFVQDCADLAAGPMPSGLKNTTAASNQALPA